jgi:hypothetical protein
MMQGYVNKGNFNFGFLDFAEFFVKIHTKNYLYLIFLPAIISSDCAKLKIKNFST